MNNQHGNHLPSPSSKCLLLRRKSVSGTKRLLLLFAATLFVAGRAHAAGQLDYIVTAPVNPVKPGELVEFDVTVHNLTTSDQPNVVLTATVPPYTSNGGFNPGDHFGVNFGTVLAGASQTRIVRLTVDNGDQAPPDGQDITLTMEDSVRGVVGIERTVTVQSIQPLNLRLSTAQASVAPGQNFTYTVSVSNVSAGTLSGVNLNVKIPQGASFVSADGATQSGADVNWALNTLPPGVNRQLHVTLKCNATENDPLGPVVATVTDDAIINHTAQASDTRAVDSSPDFEYTITSPIDPPRPGDTAVFNVTVHNRSNSDRSLTLTGTVPLFTDNGGFVPGNGFGIVFGTVSAGTSQTRIVRLTVRTGNVAPPEGAPITLNVVRFDRTASVSRTVIVHSRPALDLQLSTANATVMPGQQFTYTILASNISSTTLSDVNLQVPIPAGATFVSADGGGSSANGIVSWDKDKIGTLTAGAFRQFHVTFQAGNPTNSFLLLVEGTVSDSANNATRASDTRLVDASPAFDYTITSPPSGQRVKPGDVIEFDVTVHNRSNSDRSLTLTGTVPLFTDNGGFVPGNGFGVVFGTVLAGTFQTRIASLTVRNGTVAPPNGATITLNLIDLVRAASISRSVVVGSVSTPKADFNGDGLPDWILTNPLTHQLAVWYLNDGTFLGGAVLPTLPAGWTVIDADQFGGSGTSSDVLLFKPSTGETAVWYFNGASLVTGALGPRVPAGWTVVLSQDFNADAQPDLLLYQPSTRQTAIWYLNGTTFASGVFGPTLPVGWVVAGAADFNGDAKADLLLWNTSTRQTAIWYLNGVTFAGGVFGPTLPSGYTLKLVDDFNRDGKPDIVLWNPATHQSAIWHLNNNLFSSGVFGRTIPTGWSLTAPK